MPYPDWTDLVYKASTCKDYSDVFRTLKAALPHLPNVSVGIWLIDKETKVLTKKLLKKVKGEFFFIVFPLLSQNTTFLSYCKFNQASR